ncbi:hypothetical protein JK636_17945 [Clostridium sp. YIM B02515]|uniref:Uncharacterized protein n=1 Tax=Clostridium rhizosphaerae TaxID=2803861 RepID=A0ABS1TED4_9CLOT|nr:hypothetical protein [Clostridium rhizosphaerae]MBL4937601.1 hypothetical protein [Clostridium rhizosphaerae]
MTLINEKVEHISYGLGVVIEEEATKILVQFTDDIGNKAFKYPEAFEKFLKAVKPEVQNTILEELHSKQKRLELECLAIAQEALDLEEKISKLTSPKKRTSKTVKQKA